MKENSIINLQNVILTIIGGLIIAFFGAYFSTSEPVVYLEGLDFYSFTKDKEDTIKLSLYNRGDVPGFSRLCFSSKEMIFKSTDGFLHEVCTNEYKLNPKQTELMIPIQITAKPDANIFDFINNATIRMDVTCSQKIWSLINKNCDSKSYSYQFVKDGDRFIKKT